MRERAAKSNRESPRSPLAAVVFLAASIAGSIPVPAAGSVAAPPVSLTPEEVAQGWRLLFDGESLDGWTTSGDPEAWGVRDGEIVVLRPGKGWWLRTTRMFRDFELQLDFVVPEGGNSGVGLRGSTTGDPAFTGLEIQILDTHGEEPKLTNCGAVYDAIPPDAMAVREPGAWNHYHIRLVGDRLDAWLNGVRIHDGEKLDGRGYVHTPDRPSPLRDRLGTGYIALQDHGDAVRFRGVKILDLSPDPDPGDFEPLVGEESLDGGGAAPDALAGWIATGKGSWTREEGDLVGRDGPGHLFTTHAWSDLELRAFVRVNAHGNGGIYVRARPDPEDPGGWPRGYEVQVDQHDPKDFTGTIDDRAAAPACLTRDEAWFDMRVRVAGTRIETWIDGRPMAAATLEDFAAGHVALQTHHEGNEIRFRDLQIRRGAIPAPSSFPEQATAGNDGR